MIQYSRGESESSHIFSPMTSFSRCLFFCLAWICASVAVARATETVLDLSGPWRFALDPLARGEAVGWTLPEGKGVAEDKVAAGWDTVVVPHDFLSDPRYAATGIGWYRRSFAAPAAKEGEAPRRWRLRFDAVYRHCRVWLNGRFVGSHEGGYTPFELDVTQALAPGSGNLVVVEVDNRIAFRTLPGVRTGSGANAQQFPWLNYGGILGGVRLLSSDQVWLRRQKIETRFADGGSRIAVKALVRNDGASSRVLGVTVRLENEQGTPLGRPLAGTLELSAGEEKELTLEGFVPEGAYARWELERPSLYRSAVSVSDSRDGAKLDELSSPFGFREIRISDSRFLLNGSPVHLAGANRARGHPDSGGVDTDAHVREDLNLMKAAGLRLARLQHTPPGENLLGWADRNGMLLILEVGMWGYVSPDQASEELRSRFRAEMTELIALAQNHPSVVGWSLGNEYESWTPEGVAWTRDMARYVKNLDSTRPITFAALGKALRELGRSKPGDEHAFDHVDFVSLNLYFKPQDMPGFVDPVHARWPGKPVFVSEFGLMASKVKSEQERCDHFDRMLELVADRPWICGLSFWSFNDYASRYPGTGPDGYRRWGLVDEHRKPRALYRHVAEKLGNGWPQASGSEKK